jgi:hypothetical protein
MGRRLHALTVLSDILSNVKLRGAVSIGAGRTVYFGDARAIFSFRGTPDWEIVEGRYRQEGWFWWRKPDNDEARGF